MRRHTFSGYAHEYAGQIRHAVKDDDQWTIETVYSQVDPLYNQMIYPTMALSADEIAFTGIRRVDVLDSSQNIVRSDHYYVFASQQLTDPLPGSIHGFAFEDLDGNASWDEGEPALAGVTVTAMSDLGAAYDVVSTTDANGEYSLTNLTPGSWYLVQETFPGAAQTTLDPSNVYVANGQAYVATAAQREALIGQGVGTEKITIVTELAFGNQLALDFGDAPDLTQSGFTNSYPVTLAENGARHVAVGPVLGTIRDSEDNGIHAASADADDTIGTPDDEDGVTFTTDLVRGQNATVSVITSGSGELSFWIDFDQDGVFENATEKFAHTFASAGTEDVTFAVPASAETGQTYARFRLSTTVVTDPTGLANDGEVEDYRVVIGRKADTSDTIGLYDPSSSAFHLKNTNQGGAADLSFGFGPGDSHWRPLAGDWDGDGVDTVGLYDSATGTFYLKDTNEAGIADVVFGFGPANSTWTALAGDWDGDGRDTVGLYDSATGTFYLKDTNEAGIADVVFGFGPANSTWTALAGRLGRRRRGLNRSVRFRFRDILFEECEFRRHWGRGLQFRAGRCELETARRGLEPGRNGHRRAVRFLGGKPLSEEHER